jgi:hypothetical protein
VQILKEIVSGGLLVMYLGVILYGILGGLDRSYIKTY